MKTLVNKSRVTLGIKVMTMGLLSLLAEPLFSSPLTDALDLAKIEQNSIDDGQREGVMIGNGDLYGLIFQPNGKLVLRLTKNEIWDARMDTSADSPLPKVDLLKRTVAGARNPRSWHKPFPQPRCAIALDIETNENVNYESSLNIATGTAQITKSGKTILEARVLHHKNVCVIEGDVKVTLREIEAKHLPEATTSKNNEVEFMRFDFPGDGDYKGMSYVVAIAAKGKLTAISIVSDKETLPSNDLEKEAKKLVLDTLKTPLARQIKKHNEKWEDYWGLSHIVLEDKTMQNWWYRMLYFAKTVMEPDAYVVGLMPPLATDLTPWHSDMHHNYNMWQAFWSLAQSNRAELMKPWVNHLNEILPVVNSFGKDIFGVEGAAFPISTFPFMPDPKTATNRNKRRMSFNPYSLTLGMGGQSLASIWTYYLMTQDKEYMKSDIFPVLEAITKFQASVVDICIKRGLIDGKIELGPSYSPEHGGWGIVDCPYDIAMFQYVFKAYILACEDLGIKNELYKQAKKGLAVMPDYPINKDPQSEDVFVDWKGGSFMVNHNVSTTIFPIFPGDMITLSSPPELVTLAKSTAESIHITANNSMVMKAVARARMGNLNGYLDVRKWFVSREKSNGFFEWAGCKHGTYMSEMIGISGMINEFLLQSPGGEIRLFNGWPKDKDASFYGLRAEGGHHVDAELKDGIVTKLIIKVIKNGPLVVCSPWKTAKVNGKTVNIDNKGMVKIAAKSGSVYRFEKG